MQKIPWKKVTAFLESIEVERTVEGFLGSIMGSIERMVGFDFALNAFTSYADVRMIKVFLELRAPNGLMDQYVRHYGNLDTWLPRHRGAPMQGIDWMAQKKTEFTEFAIRFGTRHTVGISDLPVTRTEGFVLALHRGGNTPFTELEKAILGVLYPHIHNLMEAVSNPEMARSQQVRQAALAAGLSEREHDVAALLAQRLSMPEIAERLFISRHTVEKHVEHIYTKLKANGRTEARRRLMGEHTMAGQGYPWRRWVAAQAE